MFMAISVGMQHAVEKLQAQIDVTISWLKKMEVDPKHRQNSGYKIRKENPKKYDTTSNPQPGDQLETRR